MDTIAYFLASAVVLVVLIAIWTVLRRHSRATLPFTKQHSLLTAAEMRFYRVLLQAIPTDLVVLVKVRLMDVVSVPEYAWQSFGPRGSGQHLDFVLADPVTLEVQLGGSYNAWGGLLRRSLSVPSVRRA